jgi:hypothetical protein
MWPALLLLLIVVAAASLGHRMSHAMDAHLNVISLLRLILKVRRVVVVVVVRPILHVTNPRPRCSAAS